ncbi:MAG: glycosyl transferase family 90 [Pararhodobacter sp.]
MELHDFMCPQVIPATAALRDAPGALGDYPESLLFLCDFERDRIVWQTGEHSGGQRVLAEMPASAPGYDPSAFDTLRLGFRTADLIAQMRGLGALWFVGNMRDAVPFSPEIYFGHAANILQYNRRRFDRTGILWRLPQYFEPTSALGGVQPGRGEADTLAFADKRPQVVWRGNRTGRQWLSPDRYRQLSVGGDLDSLRQAAVWQPRARAVLMSLENPGLFDCRFSITARQARKRAPDAPMSPFEDRIRAHRWLLQYRYQLCLPGNDVATQLYWMMGSNALALKVDSEYDVLPDYFLEPWVHYVPVAWDLSDLRDKVDWCEANPARCRAIIERANEAHAAILDASRWEEAERIVLDKLSLLG